MTWIAFDKHRGGFEHTHCDLSHRKLLVVGFFCGDYRSVGREHEVDSRIWNQICLKLCDVDIESTIEAQRCCQRGDDLGQQAVQIGVRWTLNVQIPATYVVECFIVVHDRDIGVFKQGMYTQHSVVGLNHRCCHLWACPHSETQLGLLPVIHRQTLQQQAAQARARPSTASIVDHEALQTSAIVSKLANAIEHKIHNLLADRVVPSCEVVGSIFLPGDELLGMEQLPVRSCTHFVNDGRFQITEHSTGDVFSCSCLTEESVEGIITAPNGLVAGHLPIWLDAMLQAEQLPASIPDLDARLTKMDAQDLAHVDCWLSLPDCRVMWQRLSSR